MLTYTRGSFLKGCLGVVYTFCASLLIVGTQGGRNANLHSWIFFKGFPRVFCNFCMDLFIISWPLFQYEMLLH